jgi:hypothetical protein
MEYILPDGAVELIESAAEHLAQPYELAMSIYTEDPRLSQIIEALGGRAVTDTVGVSLMHMVMTPNEIRKAAALLPLPDTVTGGDLAAGPDESGMVGVNVRTGETKPVRLCEVCQVRPVSGPRSNICDNPDCKKTRAARYVRDAYRRKKGLPLESDEDLAQASAEELPAPMEEPEESPLSLDTDQVWTISAPWLVTTGKQSGKTLTTEQLARMIQANELEDGTHLTHIAKGEHRILPASAGYRVRVVPLEEIEASSRNMSQ